MAATEIIEIHEDISSFTDASTGRINNLMDQWCKEIKANIINEFFQFKTSFEKKQKMAIQEIQSQTPPEVIKMRREMENLRELLCTLERSVCQKDKLVSNLAKALEKEKDKYEKLRAVSFDKFEAKSGDPTEKIFEAAGKKYRNALLSKCWTAWRSFTKNKDNRRLSDTQDEPRVVEVKIEDDASEEMDVLEADNTHPNDNEMTNESFSKASSSHDVLSNSQSIHNQISSINTVNTSIQPTNEATNAIHSNTIYETAPGVFTTPSFSRITSSVVSHELPPQATEEMIITVRPEEVLPQSQIPTKARSQVPTSMAKKDSHRQKRKLKQKSEYRRGKKVNEVTKKIAIKNVQSGADPFSVADGRPTMAMNVFQISAPDTRVHPSIPNITDGNLTRNFDNRNLPHHFIMQHEPYRIHQPEQSHINPDSDQPSIHPNPDSHIPLNPDQPHQSVSIDYSRVHQNPDVTIYDANQSIINPNLDLSDPDTDRNGLNERTDNWEEAKNNISQYVNKTYMNKGEKHPTDDNWQRQSSWTVTSSSAAKSTNETEASTSGVSNPVQNSQVAGIRCTLCGHTFSSTRVLKKHLTSCTGKAACARKWVCEECGKCFLSGKRYLEDHIKAKHRGAPAKTCEICSKGFTSMSNYKVHVLIHSNERPYNCLRCNKGFAQKGNFVRHMKITHGQDVSMQSFNI